MSDETGAGTTQPMLKVVNPDATPEEIAALVAVFSSLGTAEEPKKKRGSEWSALHRRVRVNHPHGPGGWRSSGLPR
ncbi:acyl-CoA carboxylase subunit epsilon [Nocardioides sp. JQ2195]|uniref:acyl-CoA carboxylase subunit epsilon n=1 Tax=Nocardioides sp. JQ2195 TaxID=2592334 RepID=UPI0019804396|nr:acyl-CoA carboxylase subunit epsilon [Nocardioides sp. JQ2195]